MLSRDIHHFFDLEDGLLLVHHTSSDRYFRVFIQVRRSCDFDRCFAEEITLKNNKSMIGCKKESSRAELRKITYALQRSTTSCFIIN